MIAGPDLFPLLLDHAENAILALDPDRRVVYHNRRYRDLWRLPAAFLDRRPTIDEVLAELCRIGLYPREREAELVARRREHLASGAPSTRLETPRLDGVVVEGTAAPLPGGGYVLSFRDATDRVRMEAALRDELGFSRRLSAATAVAAFVLDPRHRVLLWNPACERLTGVAAADVLGTDRHWAAFYPAARPCLADLVLTGQRGRLGELYQVSGASVLADEGLHAEGWYEISGRGRRYLVFDAAPVRDAEGTVIAAVETLQDFTDHQRTREDLARLARAVDQAVEGVFLADTAGTGVYANAALAAILGQPVAALQGSRLEALLGVPEAELGAAGRQGWQQRRSHARPDGETREVDWTVSTLRDDCGALLHWVAVAHDVTRHVELERQLAHAQKLQAVGTLAGGIAHDFNNLLTVLLGNAELALDAVPPDGPAAGRITRILAAGERAQALVNHLVDFSREGAGGRRPVRLGAVVQEALAFLEPATPPGVTVTAAVRVASDALVADSAELGQALVHLVTNAFDAVGPGPGAVTVTVEEPGPGAPVGLGAGEALCLAVQDTGHGIPPELLGRIFEPFFTTRAPGQGSGLGLFAVQGIVGRHGGVVAVDGRPGAGAVFRVYLPRGDLPRTAPDPEGPGILLVDDDELFRAFAKEVLLRLGHRVSVHPTPAEALAAFSADPAGFALAVTDQVLPGITGLVLAGRLQALHPGLPVILCTGFSASFPAEELADAGVVEVLSKPVPRHALERAVTRALAP